MGDYVSIYYSIRKEENDEKSTENFLDHTRFSVPGIWYHRHCASDSADSSILYGDPVLLCEKFGTAAQLVYWNSII